MNTLPRRIPPQDHDATFSFSRSRACESQGGEHSLIQLHRHWLRQCTKITPGVVFPTFKGT